MTLYNYRWVYSLGELSFQLGIHSAIVYYAVQIIADIYILKVSETTSGNLHLMLGMMLSYTCVRVLLLLATQLFSQNFWHR